MVFNILHTNFLVYDIPFLVNKCQLQLISKTAANILRTGTKFLTLYTANIVLINVFMESVI
jgi:hypothetical protein